MADDLTWIVEGFNGKGWNVYYKGPPKEIEWVEAFRRGPATSLERDTHYGVFPIVNDPTSGAEISAFIDQHKVAPVITIPQRGFTYFGRKIYQFGSEGQDHHHDYVAPGEQIPVPGFELMDSEVWLIWATKTFLPYEVFREALPSLPDITQLVTA